jgi:hypothetical protein
MDLGRAQLDSLLGATLQRTQYSNTSKRILTDASATPQDDADIKVVSGLDVFSNNNVCTIDFDPSLTFVQPHSFFASRSTLFLQH